MIVTPVGVSDEGDVYLFAYGTLRQPEVQLAVFGRKLDGQADTLSGYKLFPLHITDLDVIATSGTADHTIVRKTGNLLDTIPGIVFTITKAELAAADVYEVSDCKRVSATLSSGTTAFVYVSADDPTSDSGS